MIIAHDDYPYHQVAATFDEAATTDIRFFDRYWFSFSDPAGAFAVIAGLGVYKNMDVLDGFVSVRCGPWQTNVRVSRALRPDLASFGAGPFHLDIVEPMRRHRLTLDENDHGIRCDVVLEATTEPFGERHYRHRDRGWVEKDYVRMFQLGIARGWVETGEERFESGTDGWPAARDRSFGARPGVGGAAPRRGGADLGSGIGAREALLVGTVFETDEHYGTFTMAEAEDGTVLYATGTIYDRAGESVEITGCSHELEFTPGTRAIERGRFVLLDRSGREWVAEIRAGARFVYQGFGYIDGWHDHLGLGASRGLKLVEGERFDLADLGAAVDESGTHDLGTPGMVHTVYTLSLDGRPGHGEGIFFLMPEHRGYGERTVRSRAD